MGAVRNAKGQIVKGSGKIPGGGRPVGTLRASIEKKVLRAVYNDFKKHGVQALIELREKDKPSYFRVVNQLLPKQIEVEVTNHKTLEINFLGFDPELDHVPGNIHGDYIEHEDQGRLAHTATDEAIDVSPNTHRIPLTPNAVEASTDTPGLLESFDPPTQGISVDTPSKDSICEGSGALPGAKHPVFGHNVGEGYPYEES